MLFISNAYAQDAAAAAPSAMSGASDLIPLILVFAIVYFLMIAPQNKKMKLHREMVSNLKVGDEIITAGGILGKVKKVEENAILLVEIAKDVSVRVSQSTVTARMGDEAVEQKKAEPKKAKTAKSTTKKK